MNIDCVNGMGEMSIVQECYSKTRNSGKDQCKTSENVLVSFMWLVTRKKECDATGTVFYPVKLYKTNTGEYEHKMEEEVYTF